LRYILIVVVLVGAFGAALYQRGEHSQPTGNREATEARVVDLRPEIQTRRVEGGTAIQLHLCFAGSCSRAKVVYEHDGEDKILDATTNCRRVLAERGLADKGISESGAPSGDGYVSEIKLGGTLPDGASNVRIVLESETGTRIAPVEL